MLPRPTASGVIATAALVLALGGTAVAGAGALLTGDDIRNGSLTGQDVRDGSLRVADLADRDLAALRGARARTTPRRGPAGAKGEKGETGATGATGATGPTGPTGPAGAPAALPSVSATGPDVVGYTDLDPLVTAALPSAGTWVLVTQFEVSNTGASGDYLNCLYEAGAIQAGTAGAQTAPGGSATGSSAGVLTVAGPGSVSLKCAGSGVTTFDIAGIGMTAVRLA